MHSFICFIVLLVRAGCVRCHGTKCPLLTVFFSLSFFLSFFSYTYFSPRRGNSRVPKFYVGFSVTKKIRFWVKTNLGDSSCPPGGFDFFPVKAKSA